MMRLHKLLAKVLMGEKLASHEAEAVAVAICGPAIETEAPHRVLEKTGPDSIPGAWIMDYVPLPEWSGGGAVIFRGRGPFPPDSGWLITTAQLEEMLAAAKAAPVPA